MQVESHTEETLRANGVGDEWERGGSGEEGAVRSGPKGCRRAESQGLVRQVQSGFVSLWN